MVDALKILQHAPAVVMAFMNAERIMALTNAASTTFTTVQAMTNDDPKDDFPMAVEFARAQYRLLDSVCNLNDDVDKYFLETAIPDGIKFFFPHMWEAHKA